MYHLLVGKNASYDGSTMTARNEDACAGVFDPEKFIVVLPYIKSARSDA